VQYQATSIRNAIIIALYQKMLYLIIRSLLCTYNDSGITWSTARSVHSKQGLWLFMNLPFPHGDVVGTRSLTVKIKINNHPKAAEKKKQRARWVAGDRLSVHLQRYSSDLLDVTGCREELFDRKFDTFKALLIVDC
jgi:hypothetical protein